MNNAAARMESLQVLRALAALAVVIFHMDWTGIASFGVELFFVLSGFIICYAAAADSDKFLLKRACRVIPLYWVATLGVAVAAGFAPQYFPNSEPSAANLVRSLLFIPYARADGATYPLLFLGWTLNYEMLFYLIFAMALAMSRALAPLIAALVLMCLVALKPIIGGMGVVTNFWTEPVLFNFVAGIIAYWFWLRKRSLLEAVPSGVALCIALTMLGLFLAGAGHWVHLGLPFNGVIGAILLLAMLRLDGWVRWPTGLLLIGDASYSLYLLHAYIVEGVDRIIHPLSGEGWGLFWTMVALCVSIAVAIAAFVVIERPSNRFLRSMLIKRKSELS